MRVLGSGSLVDLLITPSLLLLLTRRRTGCNGMDMRSWRCLAVSHGLVGILLLVGAAPTGCADGYGNTLALANSNASAPPGSPMLVFQTTQSETT